MLTFDIPIRTVSGMNDRSHWRKRAARVKKERTSVHAALLQATYSGARDLMFPLSVTLTRIGPTNGLDPFDNLPSSLKGCVDEIASWLGVDDRKDDRVRYVCKQERGPEWLVRVVIESMEAA